MQLDDTVPAGYCRCGCGRQTRLARCTDPGRGWIKGQPIFYVFGHGRRRLTAVEQLEMHTDRSDADGCWPYRGLISTTGYGKLGVTNADRTHSTLAAHRVAWEHYFGPIPPGMFVCHHCDHPACVRPDHLFLGTPKDNTNDMLKKERNSRGSKRWSARLTEDDVLAIRQALAVGVKGTTLAKQYGVARTTISAIRTGANWGHLL